MEGGGGGGSRLRGGGGGPTRDSCGLDCEWISSISEIWRDLDEFPRVKLMPCLNIARKGRLRTCRIVKYEIDVIMQYAM